MVKLLVELQSPEEVAARLASVQEAEAMCRRIDELTGNAQKCVQVLKRAKCRVAGLDSLLVEYQQYSALVYTSSVDLPSFSSLQSLPKYSPARPDLIKGLLELPLSTHDDARLLVTCSLEANTSDPQIRPVFGFCTRRRPYVGSAAASSRRPAEQ